MFTLMNEARIGVGLGATMLGYAGLRPRWTMPSSARKAGP